jgi:hypothetical protein
MALITLHLTIGTLIHADNADFLSFESAKSAFFCVQKALCKVIIEWL